MATTQNGIYYPADGTKSADILADMKEMAESVDEVVQEEKENQILRCVKAFYADENNKNKTISKTNY